MTFDRLPLFAHDRGEIEADARRDALAKARSVAAEAGLDCGDCHGDGVVTVQECGRHPGSQNCPCGEEVERACACLGWPS